MILESLAKLNSAYRTQKNADIDRYGFIENSFVLFLFPTFLTMLMQDADIPEYAQVRF